MVFSVALLPAFGSAGGLAERDGPKMTQGGLRATPLLYSAKDGTVRTLTDTENKQNNLEMRLFKENENKKNVTGNRKSQSLII